MFDYEFSIALTDMMTAPQNALTAGKIQALAKLRSYCEKLRQQSACSGILLDLLTAVCAKKIAFILGATSKTAMAEIIKPHASDLLTGRPESPYYIEEEELLGMALLFPHALPNEYAMRRYFYLFNKLRPKEAAQLLTTLEKTLGKDFVDQYRAMM